MIIVFTELYQLMHLLKTLRFVKDYLMHVDHKDNRLDVHDIFPFVPLSFPSTSEKHVYCKTKCEKRFISKENYFLLIIQ